MSNEVAHLSLPQEAAAMVELVAQPPGRLAGMAALAVLGLAGYMLMAILLLAGLYSQTAALQAVGSWRAALLSGLHIPTFIFVLAVFWVGLFSRSVCRLTVKNGLLCCAVGVLLCAVDAGQVFVYQWLIEGRVSAVVLGFWLPLVSLLRVLVLWAVFQLVMSAMVRQRWLEPAPLMLDAQQVKRCCLWGFSALLAALLLILWERWRVPYHMVTWGDGIEGIELAGPVVMQFLLLLPYAVAVLLVYVFALPVYGVPMRQPAKQEVEITRGMSHTEGGMLVYAFVPAEYGQSTPMVQRPRVARGVWRTFWGSVVVLAILAGIAYQIRVHHPLWFDDVLGWVVSLGTAVSTVLASLLALFVLWRVTRRAAGWTGRLFVVAVALLPLCVWFVLTAQALHGASSGVASMMSYNVAALLGWYFFPWVLCLWLLAVMVRGGIRAMLKMA